jgi:putative tryptophan/tyrosine transport system substrate-binding protein
MRRREFITLVSGAVALSVGARAQQQQAGKVYRIGYLGTGSFDSLPHLREAFQQGLRDLGWVEGQNIVIDYRLAEGRFDRLADLAAELVRLKVDIIVAATTPGSTAAKHATDTIPIVMIAAGDPVEVGLIASLARPGGNVTGLSFSVGMETFGKELELLKELVPSARRVAVLSNPANPNQSLAISNITSTAQSLAVELRFLEVREPNQFDDAFAAMTKDRVSALLVVSDTIFLVNRERLVTLAAAIRLPVVYGIKEHVEAGGLMSYGPSLSDLWRRAAIFVTKILRGAKPADLPVEQPTKFELVINVKAAKALGLSVPPALLVRADEVIEP